ncbi:hypothetical protein CFI11_02125 [Thalassococcus sp. S3]|nr:hypothetical protein CFI11_02125 [Thalassococcus sp. S3]
MFLICSDLPILEPQPPEKGYLDMILTDLTKAMTPPAIGFGLLVYGLVMGFIFPETALFMMGPMFFGAVLALHGDLSRTGKPEQGYTIIAMSLILPLLALVAAFKVTDLLGFSYAITAEGKDGLRSILLNLFVIILTLAYSATFFKMMWESIAEALVKRGQGWVHDLPHYVPVYAMLSLMIVGLLVLAMPG